MKAHRHVAARGGSCRPDQGLFSTGIGSERTLNAAMRSRDGQRALVYLSSQTTVLLHMDKIATKNGEGDLDQPGHRRAEGRRTSSPPGNCNGKTFPENVTQMFTVPGHWEDAVLLLEAVP